MHGAVHTKDNWRLRDLASFDSKKKAQEMVRKNTNRAYSSCHRCGRERIEAGEELEEPKLLP